MDGTGTASPDFFISRADADKHYADRIGRILEAAGYKVILQQWDFEDRDFMQMIHDGLASRARVIALLSPDYLRSDWCSAEWFETLKPDPLNKAGKFLSFMVQRCQPRGLLSSKTYCDLTRLSPGSNDLLAEIVTAWVAPGRHKRDPKVGPYWRETPGFVHPRIHPIDNFTGRAEQLADIDTALQGGEDAVITQATLSGLGGIGKSTIARQYAAEVADVEGAYAGVWWLNAAKPAAGVLGWPGIEDSLVDLWQTLYPHVPRPRETAAAAADMWGFIQASAAEKPWLLVYDNVDDGKVLDDWRPPRGARSLVTTRLQTLKGARMKRIGVAKWAMPEAKAYLITESQPRVLSQADAEAVAEAVDHLPLALSHAAAYLRDTQTAPVARYLTFLATHMTTAPEGAEYDRAVFATYQAAIAQADAVAPGAAAVMALAAHLAPDNVPCEVFEQGPQAYPAPLAALAADPLARDKALSTLHRLSLIEFDAASQTFSLHRMVQEAAKAALGGDRAAWAASSVIALAHTLPGGPGDYRNWDRYGRLMPHARVAALSAGDDTGYPLALLLGQITTYIQVTAPAAVALHEIHPMFERTRGIFERLARDQPEADPGNAGWQRDLSVSHNKIGDVLSAQGNLAQALDAFNASLAIRKRLAQADPGNAGWQRDLSVSHNKIGDVLSAQGNLAQALDAFNASLAIAQRLAQADPGNAGWQRDVAIGNERLGDIYARGGDTESACEAFENALGAYQRLIARNPGDIPSHVNSVVPLLQLGRLKGTAGRRHLEAALAILKPLASSGRLDARRLGWIPQIEAQIAALGGE